MEHAVSDEILSGTVAFYNGLNEIFRNICKISQKLLGIFGEAVAAVSKRWIVVMCADTRVQADAADDLLGVKPFGFCIGVQFIEIGNTKRQVGICKQLYSLCFCKSHE